MNRYHHAIRQPVRRPRVETNLLFTLLSFALSVSLIRLFLRLTGYPQLGGGVLHISHVLWGGLLLFVAAILPIIIANRWVYRVAAIFAGVGIGLFIDEVGKFITQSYDYFFPAAAPIVYAFFLICVLIYLQVTRPRPRSARSELYAVLELMEEVLDHDLDIREKIEIKDRLTYVANNESNPDIIRLANELQDYFTDGQILLAPDPPDLLQRIVNFLKGIEDRYGNRERIRKLLAFSLGLLGIISVIFPGSNIVEITNAGNPIDGAEMFWFIAMLVVQLFTGIALISAGLLLLTDDREGLGLRISFISLLIYLSIVNLFLFYYLQFSTILAATFQFMLLLGVVYYQRSYHATITSEEQNSNYR
jgi:hypothetical protein